jgi:hypothetical protein
MTQISRLSGGSDEIELGFVEREAASTVIMEFTIHLHLGGLSLPNTVAILDRVGIAGPIDRPQLGTKSGFRTARRTRSSPNRTR